jgi:hypothetical protein
MQLNETTDFSQCSQLLSFVHYMQADAIKEEFLFCESLLESTKAVDVLEMVNSFFLPNETLTGEESVMLFAQMELM